jgi:hypothetical protein
MADESESVMDYAENENTYRMFVALVKWSALSAAAVLILMAIFLL